MFFGAGGVFDLAKDRSELITCARILVTSDSPARYDDSLSGCIGEDDENLEGRAMNLLSRRLRPSALYSEIEGRVSYASGLPSLALPPCSD
jgi:hypothetical protein